MDALVQLERAMEDGELGAYAMGPVRRAISGWLLFSFNIFLTLIPGVNFIAPIFMFDWAKADYFDYGLKFVAKKEMESI